MDNVVYVDFADTYSCGRHAHPALAFVVDGAHYKAHHEVVDTNLVARRSVAYDEIDPLMIRAS